MFANKRVDKQFKPMLTQTKILTYFCWLPSLITYQNSQDLQFSEEMDKPAEEIVDSA